MPLRRLSDSESLLGGDALVFVGLLCLSLLGGHLVIHTRLAVLPESSVAIFIGAIFGFVLSRIPQEDSGNDAFWTFDPSIFFYVLLPPIIFEAGYSLQRRLFIDNLFPILMLAIVGTIISTIVLTALIEMGGSLGWTSETLLGGLNTTAGLKSCLQFSSLISAVDPVATLAVLSSPEVNAEANLLSILFGESVLNDAVAIVLFQTITTVNLGGSGADAHVLSALELVGAFLKESLGSTVIGLAVALCLSFVLRHGRLWERSTHIEVALTLGTGYFSYARRASRCQRSLPPPPSLPSTTALALFRRALHTPPRPAASSRPSHAPFRALSVHAGTRSPSGAASRACSRSSSAASRSATTTGTTSRTRRSS